MRFALLTLIAAVVLTGCAKTNSKRRESASPPPIVTPAQAAIGTVTTVNSTYRFVVVTFPVGQLPAVNDRLNVYRQGLKMGEVKVTGPAIDQNIVADIIAGEAQVNDEVRMN